MTNERAVSATAPYSRSSTRREIRRRSVAASDLLSAQSASLVRVPEMLVPSEKQVSPPPVVVRHDLACCSDAAPAPSVLQLDQTGQPATRLRSDLSSMPLRALYFDLANRCSRGTDATTPRLAPTAPCTQLTSVARPRAVKPTIEPMTI